jgi:hypothetical protein
MENVHVIALIIQMDHEIYYDGTLNKDKSKCFQSFRILRRK